MLKTYSIPFLSSIPAELAIDKGSHAFLLTCGDFRALAGNSYQRQYFTVGLGLLSELAEYSSN